MSDYCPIPKCPFPVPNPLRMCKAHYSMVPRPQQDALGFYAKKNKGGPAHQASFDRAVESVTKLIAGRIPTRDQVAKAKEPVAHYWDD